MPHKWIDHVKEFAKKNNISYACALTHPDLKKDYQPVIKKSYKEKREEKQNIIINQMTQQLINKIKNMNADEKPLVLMKFNGASKPIQDNIKTNYPKYYNKLFTK
jgi:TRAP-type C4-dicarboxylate transport system substrate-binding protein